MFRFSRLVKIIVGENNHDYDSNFEMLMSQGYSLTEKWHGLDLYEKGDERVIYNPNNDEIVRYDQNVQ